MRAPAQLAVDDEPEEAVAAPAQARVSTPEREGQVLSAEEPEVQDEPDVDVLGPGSVPPPTPPPRAEAQGQARRGSHRDGTDRYGEAVVRQVLGATFVREEPFEQRTRFS